LDGKSKWSINWILVDSNGFEASRGDASTGDDQSRKYIISCQNRPLQDRLPFNVVMDVTNPTTRDESKFSFYADWSMPNSCKPGWWTGTTNGKNSAGASECYGYTAYKMHCDGWENWYKWDREFVCWFPYLGTGGDKAPPGSRRHIGSGVEGKTDMILEAAAGDLVEEEQVEQVESPRAEARGISFMRRGWGALFGR
jgi:hypothetical protein